MYSISFRKIYCRAFNHCLAMRANKREFDTTSWITPTALMSLAEQPSWHWLNALGRIWHHVSQCNVWTECPEPLSSIYHISEIKINVSCFTKIEYLRLHLSRAFVKSKTLPIHDVQLGSIGVENSIQWHFNITRWPEAAGDQRSDPDKLRSENYDCICNDL